MREVVGLRCYGCVCRSLHNNTVAVSYPSSADRHFGALLIICCPIDRYYQRWVGGLHHDKAGHNALDLRAGVGGTGSEIGLARHNATKG